MAEDKNTKRKTRSRIESPFGKNLTELLKERGLSLRAAAEIAGVEPSVVSGWTQGNIPADLLKVQKLCRVLNADFEQLLTGESTKIDPSKLTLSQLFEAETLYDGVLHITAKRLKRKEG